MGDLQWFHCNQCYTDFESTQQSGLQFFITSCAHTFCRDCLSKANPTGSQGVVCFLCEAPCSLLPLDKKLPKEVERFFENPVEKMEASLEVLKFQRGHQFRLVNHLRRVAVKQQETLQKAKAELLNVKEIQRQFSIISQRCERLEAENSSLQTENQRLRQGFSGDLGSDYASNRDYRSSHQPPKSSGGESYRGSRDFSAVAPPSTPTGPSRLSLKTPLARSPKSEPRVPSTPSYPSRPPTSLEQQQQQQQRQQVYQREQLRTPSLPNGIMGRSNQSMQRDSQELRIRPTTAMSQQLEIKENRLRPAQGSEAAASLKRPYSAINQPSSTTRPLPSPSPVPRNRAGFPSNFP